MNNNSPKTQVQVQVNIKNLDDLVCNQCHNRLFVQAVALKHISALQSPSRKEGQVVAPAGFLCSNCGTLNDFQRVAPGEEPVGAPSIEEGNA